VRLRAAEREAAEQFFEAVAKGHEGEASAIMLEVYLRGVSPVKILDVVLTVTMHRVGKLWHRGQMSVADEHLATRTAICAIETLRGTVARGRVGASARLAVCCAPEEELHDVSLLCAQTLLESEGWRVRNFGANTPFFALTETVERLRPKLVCISSTAHVALDRSARDYRQLHDVARGVGARVVLGGEGFRDREVRRRFPADLYADNFQDLLKFIREGEKH
jgi:methanogenic corrinoid protein MtbC1